jgi:hypothetical protein
VPLLLLLLLLPLPLLLLLVVVHSTGATPLGSLLLLPGTVRSAATASAAPGGVVPRATSHSWCGKTRPRSAVATTRAVP